MEIVAVHLQQQHYQQPASEEAQLPILIVPFWLACTKVLNMPGVYSASFGYSGSSVVASVYVTCQVFLSSCPKQ
jgi:hypothetical protein